MKWVALLMIPASVASAAPLTESLNRKWKGKSLVELTGQFPEKAVYDKSFPASEAAGEFRTAVLNAYPAKDPKSAKVTIREIWWRRGDYNHSFFLHQVNGKWVVLEAIKWQKDVKF